MELLLWRSFPGPPGRTVHEDVSSWWWWISNRQEGICWGGRSRISCQQPPWLVEFPVCLSRGQCHCVVFEVWRAQAEGAVLCRFSCSCCSCMVLSMHGRKAKGLTKSFRSKNHGEIQKALNVLIAEIWAFVCFPGKRTQKAKAGWWSFMCACLPDGRGKSQLDCKHVKITSKEKALGRSYSTFQYQKGLQESWRGTFYKGMEWLDKGEWL